MMKSLGGFQCWKNSSFLLVIFLFVFLLMLSVAFGWVYIKRSNALEQLENMDLRYSRMLGVYQQSQEIDAALEKVNSIRSQYAFSEEIDTNQAGAQVQQELRKIMSQSNVQIQSMQLQASPDIDAGYEKISLVVSGSGEWENIQKFIDGIRLVKPYLLIDKLNFNLRGDLELRAKYSPFINFQISVSFFRKSL